MKKFSLIILSYLFMNLSVLASGAKTEEYLNLEWWRGFNDDCLIENLLEVYTNNYDLKNTALKIKANEQAVKMQFANELPAINFSGEISRDLRSPRQKFGDMTIPQFSQNNFYLPITAGYEIDIWGKNRLKTKSKKEQFEIVKQAERATYISLTSNFATDYFNLIKADKLSEIQEEMLNTQKEILSKTTEKYKIGLIPVTEVLRQEKLLNSIKEEKNNYDKAKEILQNNLKVYLASTAEDVERSSFEEISLIEKIPEKYNSAIVENRPDYMQEEANVKRLGFDVRIAKKEFLPSFTIFGQIGLNAYTLSSLCNSPSQFFSAGILPDWDIFSGGRKTAMLKMQKYRYEEALNNYQNTYLTAVNEINSGLIDYKTAKNNYKEANEKFSTERKIYDLATDKRDIGCSNDLDILYAKMIYLETQKEVVSNKINCLLSTIGLYKAVGGKDLREINDESNL